MIRRIINLILGKPQINIGEFCPLKFDKNGFVVPKLGQYSMKDGSYYSKGYEVKAMLKYVLKNTAQKRE